MDLSPQQLRRDFQFSSFTGKISSAVNPGSTPLELVRFVEHLTTILLRGTRSSGRQSERFSALLWHWDEKQDKLEPLRWSTVLEGRGLSPLPDEASYSASPASFNIKDYVESILLAPPRIVWRSPPSGANPWTRRRLREFSRRLITLESHSVVWQRISRVICACVMLPYS